MHSAFSNFGLLGQQTVTPTHAPSAMVSPPNRGGSVMQYAPSSMIAPGRTSVLGVTKSGRHFSVAPVRR